MGESAPARERHRLRQAHDHRTPATHLREQIAESSLDDVRVQAARSRGVAQCARPDVAAGELRWQRRLGRDAKRDGDPKAAISSAYLVPAKLGYRADTQIAVTVNCAFPLSRDAVTDQLSPANVVVDGPLDVTIIPLVVVSAKPPPIASAP